MPDGEIVPSFVMMWDSILLRSSVSPQIFQMALINFDVAEVMARGTEVFGNWFLAAVENVGQVFAEACGQRAASFPNVVLPAGLTSDGID